MAQDHPLDDPHARTAVVDSVSRGGSLTEAGAAAGVSKTRLSRYLKKHEDFALEVAAARLRCEIVAHHAPRMLPAVAIVPGSDSSAAGEFGDHEATHEARVTPEGREMFLKLLAEHARDGGSKGCAKALDIIAQLHLAPEILAMQAQAKRDAADADKTGEGSSRPLVIRAPAARSGDSAVIEAEVVDPREKRH